MLGELHRGLGPLFEMFELLGPRERWLQTYTICSYEGAYFWHRIARADVRVCVAAALGLGAAVFGVQRGVENALLPFLRGHG